MAGQASDTEKKILLSLARLEHMSLAHCLVDNYAFNGNTFYAKIYLYQDSLRPCTVHKISAILVPRQSLEKVFFPRLFRKCLL